MKLDFEVGGPALPGGPHRAPRGQPPDRPRAGDAEGLRAPGRAGEGHRGARPEDRGPRLRRLHPLGGAAPGPVRRLLEGRAQGAPQDPDRAPEPRRLRRDAEDRPPPLGRREARGRLHRQPARERLQGRHPGGPGRAAEGAGRGASGARARGSAALAAVGEGLSVARRVAAARREAAALRARSRGADPGARRRRDHAGRRRRAIAQLSRASGRRSSRSSAAVRFDPVRHQALLEARPRARAARRPASLARASGPRAPGPEGCPRARPRRARPRSKPPCPASPRAMREAVSALAEGPGRAGGAPSPPRRGRAATQARARRPLPGLRAAGQQRSQGRGPRPRPRRGGGQEGREARRPRPARPWRTGASLAERARGEKERVAEQGTQLAAQEKDLDRQLRATAEALEAAGFGPLERADPQGPARGARRAR